MRLHSMLLSPDLLKSNNDMMMRFKKRLKSITKSEKIADKRLEIAPPQQDPHYRALEPLYQSQQYQNPRIERFTNS